MGLINIENEACFGMFFVQLLHTSPNPEYRVEILHSWGNECKKAPELNNDLCDNVELQPGSFCTTVQQFPLKKNPTRPILCFELNPKRPIIAMLTELPEDMNLELVDSRRMCAEKHVYSLQMIVRHLLCSQHPELTEKLKAQNKVPAGLAQILTLERGIL